MRSDFYHLDIFQWTKTGKKFAIFVFGRGEKFGFLAKIFTLELKTGMMQLVRQKLETGMMQFVRQKLGIMCTWRGR